MGWGWLKFFKRRDLGSVNPTVLTSGAAVTTSITVPRAVVMMEFLLQGLGHLGPDTECKWVLR